MSIPLAVKQDMRRVARAAKSLQGYFVTSNHGGGQYLQRQPVAGRKQKATRGVAFRFIADRQLSGGSSTTFTAALLPLMSVWVCV